MQKKRGVIISKLLPPRSRPPGVSCPSIIRAFTAWGYVSINYPQTWFGALTCTGGILAAVIRASCAKAALLVTLAVVPSLQSKDYCKSGQSGGDSCNSAKATTCFLFFDTIDTRWSRAEPGPSSSASAPRMTFFDVCLLCCSSPAVAEAEDGTQAV